MQRELLMNQFVLCQKNAAELQLFPHILEIGAAKNAAIRLNGFPTLVDTCLKIYCIQEGKFEWSINRHPYQLFPGDVVLVLPGVSFGNENDVLEIGSFSWIHLDIPAPPDGRNTPAGWSRLSKEEQEVINRIFRQEHTPVFQKFPEIGNAFKSLQTELFNQEIGYQTRINHQLDDLFILMARQFTRITNPGRDFPKTFMQLEDELRRNLSHQWTVEEMAGKVGLGSTLFNEKVKSYSGFSPLNYLINIRISEAIKLLKKPDISLTDIAYDTGFYSSQHFSTTFKKLTGYSPSQFRKNHLKTK